MSNVLGIDPSLTATALCWGDDPEQSTVVKSKPIGKSVRDRMQRIETICEQVAGVLQEIQPSLVLIEGYAYGANGAGQMFIGELGGLLRYTLCDYAGLTLEVAATSLKRFATDKGNSPKDLVIAHVRDKWGRMCKSNDEADAFVLFKMAETLAGRIEATTKAQRETIKTILKSNTLTADDLQAQCHAGVSPN